MSHDRCPGEMIILRISRRVYFFSDLAAEPGLLLDCKEKSHQVRPHLGWTLSMLASSCSSVHRLSSSCATLTPGSDQCRQGLSTRHLESLDLFFSAIACPSIGQALLRRVSRINHRIASRVKQDGLTDPLGLLTSEEHQRIQASIHPHPHMIIWVRLPLRCLVL